jgi:hypothetical protein
MSEIRNLLCNGCGLDLVDKRITTPKLPVKQQTRDGLPEVYKRTEAPFR